MSAVAFFWFFSLPYYTKNPISWLELAAPRAGRRYNLLFYKVV